MAICAGGGAGSRMVRRGSTLPIGGNPPRVVAMHSIPPPSRLDLPFSSPSHRGGGKGPERDPKGGVERGSFPFPTRVQIRSIGADGRGWMAKRRKGRRCDEARDHVARQQLRRSAQRIRGRIGGGRKRHGRGRILARRCVRGTRRKEPDGEGRTMD
eukprot:scaffold2858_cov659-Pavlova_lutheri.AAC.40